MKPKASSLLSIVLALALSSPSTGQSSEAAPKQVNRMPVTGRAASGMASFDRLGPELMRKWNIPGGAVAVSVEGRLVFARGHARADRKKGETVQPDSLFRIASLSKPITAAAILKLVEESQLRLDDKLRHLSQQPLLERVTAALPEFFAELSVLLNCGASYIHRVRNPSHQR